LDVRVILGADCVAALFAIVRRSGRSCACSTQVRNYSLHLKITL